MSKENKSKKSLSKKDLVDVIAQRVNCTKTQTNDFVDAFIEEIINALKKGEEIAIAGFGKFSTSDRAARDGRNPQTGASIKIPASTTAKFTPYQVLKDTLNPNKKK